MTLNLIHTNISQRQDRVGQDGTGWDRVGQGGTGQNRQDRVV